MSRHYNQLSLSERRTLHKFLEAGKSKLEIARHLGRHRSTIYREIQRNTLHHEDAVFRGYFHVAAQERAAERRSRLCKLVQRHDLRSYIIGKLEKFWSPDQIAGYMRRINTTSFYASPETIYAFIYSDHGRSLKLYRFLRKAFKNRRKRFTRKARGLRGIPQHLSINQRPEEVSNRNNFGHWEGDLMLFKREYGNVNVTSLVERKSRYTFLFKNKGRSSVSVLTKIKDKLCNLPWQSRRSITFDCGSKFLAWDILSPHLVLGSYYCDPRSPWQKGTNENTNGRIRKFLPQIQI